MSNAKKVQSTEDQARSLYKEYKKIPLAMIQGTSESVILERMGKAAKSKAIAAEIKLFGRVAHQVSESEFIDAIVNNEVPPVKLTPEEMEVLRGGLIGTCIGIGIALGAILFAGIAVGQASRKH